MTTVGSYKTTPITLKIRSRHDDGAGTDLKLIKGDIYRETEFNGTMSLSFSTVNPILCRLRETDEYTHENPGYSLIDNENEILLDGHVYKIKQITDRGNYKRLTCVHEFSELSKVQRYEYIEGTTTIGFVLDYLFDGTGWNVETAEGLREIPITFPPEKVGIGSVLKVMKEMMKRLPIEYVLLPDKTIHFSFGVFGSTRVDFEYGVNIKGVSTESDSTDLYTRIRGYYSNVVGQDENGDDIIDGWNHVEVINEAFENEYGALEMDSLWESNIKSAGEMEFACWLKLYSAVKYNIDLTAVEFEVQAGQYVNITHPTVNVTEEFTANARIFNVKEGLINNELKPIEVTIANYTFSHYEEITNDRLDSIENELRTLKNRTTNFMLSKFTIGNKNALAIPGVLLGANTTIPQDITATLEYKDLEEFKGLFITKKTAYDNFHVQVTTYNKANAATGTYDGNTSALEAWLLPNDNVAAICVEVYQNAPEPGADEQPKQKLAVKFEKTGGSDAGDYLSEFRIGDVDCLSLSGVMSDLSTATADTNGAYFEYTESPLMGLFLSLKTEFANSSVKFKGIIENGEALMSDIPFLNLGTSYAGMDYLNDEEFPLRYSTTNFEIIIMVSDTVDVNELDYGSEGQLYKVKFVDKTPFEVIYTIYAYDAITGPFKVFEEKFTEVGEYEINPPQIEGYVLAEVYEPIIVNVSKNTVPYEIWYEYKKINTNPDSKYKMEFGIAPLSNDMFFTFSKTVGYEMVGAITTAISGDLTSDDVSLKTTLIQNDGKYIGVRVLSNKTDSNTSLSIMAVCYDEE